MQIYLQNQNAKVWVQWIRVPNKLRFGASIAPLIHTLFSTHAHIILLINDLTSRINETLNLIFPMQC